MKCQVCGEAEATIHFKELKNDKMRELHLCPGCAEEKGFQQLVEHDKLSLTNQFIWMAENLSPETSAKIGQVRCGGCGISYGEFTQTGRLGCAKCYASFETQLHRLLRRIHGATRHVGKTVGETTTGSSRLATLQRLQAEMQRAISGENFERAAEIRDELRALQDAQPREEPAE